jgi:hypothetical protein
MKEIQSFLKSAVLRKSSRCTFEEVYRNRIHYVASLKEKQPSFPLYGTRYLSYVDEHKKSRERTLMKVVRLLEHSYVEGHRIIISGLPSRKDALCLAAGFLLLLREAESLPEAAVMLKRLDPSIDPAPLRKETWLNELLV